MKKTGPRIALIALLLAALLAAGSVGLGEADGGDDSRQEAPPITDDDPDDDSSANEGLDSVMPITEDARLEQIAKENPGFGHFTMYASSFRLSKAIPRSGR